MHSQRIRLTCLALAVCMVSVPVMAADLVTDRAANTRAALVAQYEALTPLPTADRKDVYAGLEPVVQSDLWVLHLERFLAEHPELTAEQRGVIYEGIGMLRAGLFDRLYSADSAQVVRAREDLDSHKIRAQAILPVELAAKAFTQIGRGPAPEPAFDPLAARWRVVANAPYCICNVADNDCWTGGCVYWTHSCRPTTGCGWFFTKGCDGLCY